MLGKDRAQSITSEKSPTIKLPPINTNVSTVHVETNVSEIGKRNGQEIGKKSDDKDRSTSHKAQKENNRRKSPVKGVTDEFKKVQKLQDEKSAEKDGSKSEERISRNDSKSPKKKPPKRKKKTKTVKERDAGKEAITVMTAAVNEKGTVNVSYEPAKEEKSSLKVENLEREDTTGMNEKVIKIMEEEKMKLKKVREVIEATTIAENRSKKNRINFKSHDLSVDDMIVMKVSEKHFIPGQPCLGKIVSLPDAVGVLLVHYYSGSFDSVWKPMMSRSSPYLRRVPLSRIVYKFKLSEDGKMSEETIEKVKEVIQNENEK